MLPKKWKEANYIIINYFICEFNKNVCCEKKERKHASLLGLVKQSEMLNLYVH